MTNAIQEIRRLTEALLDEVATAEALLEQLQATAGDPAIFSAPLPNICSVDEVRKIAEQMFVFGGKPRK